MVQWDNLNAFDDPILLGLNGFLVAHERIGHFAEWLSFASLFKFGPFGLAFVWFWFAPGSDQEERRGLVIKIMIMTLVAVVTARLMALLLPFRLRPLARPELALQVPEWVNQGVRSWSAFPSDHAVVSFAMATGLARLSRRTAAVLMLHAVLVILLPRVFLARHHPTDLIFGALFGALIALWVPRMPQVDRLSRGAMVLEHTRPALYYAASFFLLFEICEMFDSVRIGVGYVFKSLQVVSTG